MSLRGKTINVISLNMMACHPRNWWLYKGDRDPGGQLKWLEKELKKIW